MKFDWDENKAAANLKKHQVSFETARRAFDDPFALRTADEKHSTLREVREWLIGEADGKILVVVFTLREYGLLYRLISARKANRKERVIYEAFKGIPV